MCNKMRGECMIDFSFQFRCFGSRRLLLKRKREPTMLRRDLKGVGNHLSRCNNSSPRYMREFHYAILARLKISYILKSQDKHNASFFQNVVDSLKAIQLQS